MPRIPQHIATVFWEKPETLAPAKFTCGYCGSLVSSEKGWRLIDKNRNQQNGVFICPDCKCPTFVYPREDARTPDSAFGSPVQNLPHELEALYEEARSCTAHGAYTVSVLILRKMLMNIAVNQGAAEGLRFIEYVDYLAVNHFIPPNGRHWVDHIRKKGNEATHEIALMNHTDAKDLIVFIEMLLRFIYEFPSMIPQPTNP
ncbi:MAG: DUF4145 domain-containing protein [Limisphaerales bacterium]